MPYRDFNRLWRVKESAEDAACQPNSIVTFVRADIGNKVTILCAQLPYDENTGCYKPPPDNTIEVTFEGNVYVISMGGTCEKPTITFAAKQQGPGPFTGSWTAEDYVPGPPPEPSGQ